MAFQARRVSDNALVVPEQVEDGVDLECTACGARMRTRGPSSDGRARHFFHSIETDCAGGESDIHRKQKSLVASALRMDITEWGQCELEATVDVSETRTNVDTRRADVLAEFESEHEIFGRGIVVEVQYRNRGKDLDATTFDYLSKGYSVLWAYQEDFSERRFDLEDAIAYFDQSPDSYRPTETAPEDLLPLGDPEFDGTWHYLDEGVEGAETPTMRVRDGCDHCWTEMDEFLFQCDACQAVLHSAPEFALADSGSSGEPAGQSQSREPEYVISLDSSVSADELISFEPRGGPAEIRAQNRLCSNCGTHGRRLIGWDGRDLYPPSMFREQLEYADYGDLEETDDGWVQMCTACGEPIQMDFADAVQLYMRSDHLDTLWLPAQAESPLR